MKTKELIEQLQKADPSGEIECCIENAAIGYIHKEYAYYDGCLQIIIGKDGRYSAKIMEKGYKIFVNPVDLETHVFDDPDFEIDINNLTGYYKTSWERRIERWRKEGRMSIDELERTELNDELDKLQKEIDEVKKRIRKKEENESS